MVSNDDILYLINIKTMKIYQEFFLLDYPGKIDFIYKIKDNIYICKDNTLLELKYLENQITLINSKEQYNLFSLNYLKNLFIEKKYPKLHNKILINCIENNIIKHRQFLYLDNHEDKLYEIIQMVEMVINRIELAKKTKQKKYIKEISIS